tara:strand:- start:279 stop:509 length:231 start_codon:yes stop_codon:yes gene_type:complete
MTLDDLKADLSERLGHRVTDLFTRDGEPANAIIDLYCASPAGFGGKLSTSRGKQFAWELWLEDEEHWNFQAKPVSA